MQNILITGGAGFIGSRLAARLSGDGHQVRVLDNLHPQVHGERFEESPLYRATKSVAEVMIGDVTSRDDVAAALAGQDIVVHLAAETGTGQSMYEIERYSRVNIGGTALLLDLLANNHHSVTRVVVASSRSIYGEGRYLSRELGYVYPGTRRESDMKAGRFEPTYEGDRSGLELVATTEDSAIHPSSVYGITKQTQESLVMTVCPTLGIEPIALRYQNVYGPGQSLTNPYTGILSIFSSQILHGREINVFEDGLESRDFVYVEDVVQATASACLVPSAGGLVANVGSGVPTTVSQVVHELQQAYGVEVPVAVTGNFRLGDIRHNYADISLAEERLGYTVNHSFGEGLREFARWVRDQERGTTSYEDSLEEMRVKGLLK